MVDIANREIRENSVIFLCWVVKGGFLEKTFLLCTAIGGRKEERKADFWNLHFAVFPEWGGAHFPHLCITDFILEILDDLGRKIADR